MTVLVDIAHPAHVHFYKHVVWGLERQGIVATLVARNKDVTCQLLDNYGFKYVVVGKSEAKGIWRQATELLERDSALVRIARRTKARVILTRNPAGAQAGRLLGIKSIFDTDDGRAAGLHFRAAAPFAHVITTPDCMRDYLGPRHLKYPGYKQTAYLHPHHFRPNPEVLERLGVAPGERFFIVRFVAMVASHDAGEAGLPWPLRQEVLRRLKARGKVFISSETPLDDALGEHRFELPPEMLHDALAFASLLVGDSQTMAAEAAVLGTPNLRVSSWKGRLDYLEELEHRFGLTESFSPDQGEALLTRLDALLAEENPRGSIAERQRALFDHKCDVAEWYTRYVLASL